MTRADFLKTPALAVGLQRAADSPSVPKREIWRGRLYGQGDSFKLNGCWGMFSISCAFALLDALLDKGIDREKLHWRMAGAQRMTMLFWQIQTGTDVTIREIVHNASGFDSGLLLDIPYVVDRSHSKESVTLWAGDTLVGEVTNLAIPAGYTNG